MHNRGFGALLRHGRGSGGGRKRGRKAQRRATLWDKINASGAATIGASQAQGYVTNFKAADMDSDGTLTKTEFQAACAKGLVQDSASSGAAAGTEGSDETMPPAAERPSKLSPSQKQY